MTTTYITPGGDKPRRAPRLRRAGSSDSHSINYQCEECNHVVRDTIGKPGDRRSLDGADCPRCKALGRTMVDTSADVSYTG